MPTNSEFNIGSKSTSKNMVPVEVMCNKFSREQYNHYIYSCLLLLLLFPLGAQGIHEKLVSLQFLNLRQSVWLLGLGITPVRGHYLTQTQNKGKQTSMSWVGFEPTIPVFEWVKTFHALDCVATVISIFIVVGLLNTLMCSGNLSVTAGSIQNACESSMYPGVDYTFTIFFL
jgi:hypothetical protein